MRPLLVGEAPTRRSRDLSLAFTGSSGERLSVLLGRPVRDVFECVNLFSETLVGWSAPAARTAAVQLLQRYDGPGPILLAGRRVARAFGPLVATASWFEPVRCLPGGPFAVIPHPSGLNRWYNSPANREQARVFLRSLAEQGAAAWQPSRTSSS